MLLLLIRLWVIVRRHNPDVYVPPAPPAIDLSRTHQMRSRHYRCNSLRQFQRYLGQCLKLVLGHFHKRRTNLAVFVAIAVSRSCPRSGRHEVGRQLVCPTQVPLWCRGCAYARHAMVCRKAPGRIDRHHALNDIVWRALNSAGVPSTKEPTGLCRQDGKRPDGLSLIPWQNGKPLVWDVTVVIFVSTLVDSERKSVKYNNLQQNHFFQPIAVENLGALSTSAMEFLNALGRRISSVSGEDRESTFLFQRISVNIQRFNSVLLQILLQFSHVVTQSLLFLTFVSNSRDLLYYLG